MAHSPTLAHSQPGDAGRSGEGPPGGATLEKALPGRSSRPHPHAVLSSCPAARFLDLGPSHLEKPRVSEARGKLTVTPPHAVLSAPICLCPEGQRSKSSRENGPQTRWLQTTGCPCRAGTLSRRPGTASVNQTCPGGVSH